MSSPFLCVFQPLSQKWTKTSSSLFPPAPLLLTTLIFRCAKFCLGYWTDWKANTESNLDEPKLYALEAFPSNKQIPSYTGIKRSWLITRKTTLGSVLQRMAVEKHILASVFWRVILLCQRKSFLLHVNSMYTTHYTRAAAGSPPCFQVEFPSNGFHPWLCSTCIHRSCNAG